MHNDLDANRLTCAMLITDVYFFAQGLPLNLKMVVGALRRLQRKSSYGVGCLWGLWAVVGALPAIAAPFTPTGDAVVLERLPERAADPRTREMRQLRQQLRAAPSDLGIALRLARRYYEEVAAEGDPRYIGYAQAALAPWWDQAEPPPELRVMRAVLRQFSHQFEPALVDLRAAAAANPADGEAWSWLTAIAMVQARYNDARDGCQHMRPLAEPLIGVACEAAVDAITGRADAASAKLRRAIDAAPQTSPAARLWAMTRLAEIEARRGDAAAAEAVFQRALALQITDGYLLAAYSDFLLDQQRPAEVLTLLKGRERSDLLLLRMALAAKATQAPQAARWADDLGARFDAARLRGDTVHQKEEARYWLGVRGDAARALPLAEANYKVQLEPADARALMEVAIAARQPAAAAPAMRWLQDNQVESVVLRRLAAQLKGQS